jgi:hypothetical protein
MTEAFLVLQKLVNDFIFMKNFKVKTSTVEAIERVSKNNFDKVSYHRSRKKVAIPVQ